ncbi:MAG: hypothetical protein ABFR90_11735 [Planctomycetota bacterium]
MNKCEPWAIAAVYLMQSASGREHYTDIVNYILETELTELTEKGVATSRTVNELLSQKVINNRAIFDTDGNGNYSLNDAVATLKDDDVQGVIKSLKDNNLEVNLFTHEDKENKPVKEDEMPDGGDDSLSDDAAELSKVTKKLSDDARRLSDETIKLSDETIRLSDENKELRQEIRGLREENEQLKEKLQSINQLCEC